MLNCIVLVSWIEAEFRESTKCFACGDQTGSGDRDFNPTEKRNIVRIYIVTFLLLVFVRVAIAAPSIEMTSVKGGCFKMGDTFGDVAARFGPSGENRSITP